MEETKQDDTTRAGAAEPVADRGRRDSPTRACAAERAGERGVDEPKRGISTRARASKKLQKPQGRVPLAGETGGKAKAEEMGGAAEGEFCPEVPEDVIYAILSKLPPCRTEQWAFSCLNQRWNLAVKSLLKDHSPQIPSLILPSSCSPFFHSTVSCQWNEEQSIPTSTCLWRKLYLPDDVRVDGKMCGSSEGGWFILVLENSDPNKHRNHLFSIHTREMKELPDTVLISEEVSSFSLEAAVLSSSASLPGYTVAAIGKEPSSLLAIKTPLMNHWHNVQCNIPNDDSLVDLIYFKSEFWFLTAQERVGKLSEDQDGSGNSRIYWLEMTTKQRHSYLSDTEYAEKNLRTKRYLVESDGELYMVIKFLALTGGAVEIAVFRLDLNEAEEGSDSSSDSSMMHCDQLYFT
uniref:Uncharacterized protein n=1 Tax=Avena sativa TaxID=4498 RepID=A0ACD5UGQ6_AVESA